MSGAHKTESTPTKPSSPAKERTGFECAEAAAALLNCVAARSYNDMKCIPLMKKLRACIEKQVPLCCTTSPAAVLCLQTPCCAQQPCWLALALSVPLTRVPLDCRELLTSR